MKRRITAATLGIAGLGVLTACSPTDIHAFVTNAGQGYHVDAKAGPDDGRGSAFAAAVVCNGENFWRYGAVIDTNSSPNYLTDRYQSNVACPGGRTVVGATVWRPW